MIENKVLARINRVTTMGELVASMAHEVNQPIGGVLINANVCLRKLGHDNPDLDEARAAVTRIQRDAKRAADVVGRIRSQFEKAAPNREILDINEIIRETAGLLRSEACDTTSRSGRNWQPIFLRSSEIACNCSKSR